MVRTREVIPLPLEHALLSTRVLAALYALDEQKKAPLLDGVFDEAAKLLEIILKGRKDAQERSVSGKSAEYALAYGEAIRAIEMLPNRPKVSEEVGKLLSNLIRTAEALRAGDKVKQESVQEIRQFFELLRNVAARASARR